MNGRLLRSLMARAVGSRLKVRFNRIVLVGDWPHVPGDLPLIAYANHHGFFDGQILCYVLHQELARRPIVWSRPLHKFPNQILRSAGAMPFPVKSAQGRAATVRKTRALMRADPRSALVYFPEGVLHPAEEGVLPAPPDLFARFDRVLPAKWWVPVGLTVRGWHEVRPTVRIAFGEPHRRSHGGEIEALRGLLTGPLADPRAPTRTLLQRSSLAHALYKGLNRRLRRD